MMGRVFKLMCYGETDVEVHVLTFLHSLSLILLGQLFLELDVEISAQLKNTNLNQAELQPADNWSKTNHSSIQDCTIFTILFQSAAK